MRVRDRDLVRERLEDLGLHVEHLAVRVRLVGDVHAVVHLRRVDLFVLARDEQRGHADELQLRAHHLLRRAVSVDEPDAVVERRRREPELHVDLDEPIDLKRARETESEREGERARDVGGPVSPRGGLGGRVDGGAREGEVRDPRARARRTARAHQDRASLG